MTLTASERRGALALLAILVLGAARDLWETRVRHGVDAPPAATASVTPAGPRGAGAAPARPAADTGSVALVDLNTASASELDGLPGVGPVLAARIVAYRREHGGFRAVDELLAVRGIGPRSFARMRPRLTAGPALPRASDPVAPRSAADPAAPPVAGTGH